MPEGIFGNTEEDLATRLREQCYANGREKEPKRSAAIFHELGFLYMKKYPDKISMIQAAALFNAGIVRKPDNVVEIQKDLEKLCSMVLKAAGVLKGNVDLVSAAKTCKNAVIQYRSETVQEIAKLHKIPDTSDLHVLHKAQKTKIKEVQILQNNITENYLSIMKYLSDFCLSILGQPPSLSRFALVGMGSLARKEITPYSDFENIIVLEEGSQLKENYSEIVEYFRWFSVIFQIILINMGETVVPSIALPSLNDFTKPNGDWFYDAYTPCGLSFDGLMPYACKHPLGRQKATRRKSGTTELIKPPSAMVQFLDRDQNLKNGYHLADVLSKTCFVSGDRSVYEDFAERTCKKLTLHRQNKEEFAHDIKKQILDDQLKFDVNTNCSNMYSTSKFNLKRVIYRSTTIFISALGTFHGIKEASCFDIITRLREKELISREEKHHLQYAVAVACEVRLKIYMKREKQSDWIENRTLGSELSEILEVVGGKCVVDYFTIARAFQSAVMTLKFEDPSQATKLNLHLDHKYTIDICCKLRLHKTCIQECEKLLNKKSLSLEEEASCYYYTGISWLDLDKPREAKKYFEKELNIRKKHPECGYDKLIADCYYYIGRCCNCMTLYDKALEVFNKELIIRKRLTANHFRDVDVAFCMREIASCLLSLNQVEKALTQYEQVLEIWRRVPQQASTIIHIIHCLSQIGVCLMKLQRYESAIKTFKEELGKRKRITTDENTDLYVAECLYRIGVCLRDSDQCLDAIEQFERALSIHKQFQRTKERNKCIASCLYNISICKYLLNPSNSPNLFP